MEEAERRRLRAERRARDARIERRAAPTTAERARLSELVERVACLRAEKARLDGEEVAALAEADAIAQAQCERMASPESRLAEIPWRCIAAELALAVRVNDRGMQTQMNDAAALYRLFPATLTALRAGRISRRHADEILAAGHAIGDDEARGRFEAAILPHAETHTAGEVRARARQLAERLDPRSLADRFAEAATRRAVTTRPLEDGMGELLLVGPIGAVFGIRDRLTRQAKALRALPAAEGVHDERTLDQVRADIATDMLLTGAPAIDPAADHQTGGLGSITAHVQITVPITTLAGTTDSGAEIDGCAPIDPETARRFAGDCPGWDRVMIHPVTGIVQAVDRYRPSEELKRTLRARDRHCQFPGCRTPARHCDIDHTQDAAEGGATALCNLCCFCKRHHTLKHATDWTVRQLGDGVLEWTSPAGRSYQDDPPPHVVFTPDPYPDPPPF